MGNRTISSEQLREYHAISKNCFTKSEIIKYYEFWHGLYPNGTMDSTNFHKFIEIAMPSLKKPAQQEEQQDQTNEKQNSTADLPDAYQSLFRAMDVAGNGVVTFKYVSFLY
jgi:hypothetical protein